MKDLFKINEVFDIFVNIYDFTSIWIGKNYSIKTKQNKTKSKTIKVKKLNNRFFIIVTNLNEVLMAEIHIGSNFPWLLLTKFLSEKKILRNIKK